MNLRSFLTGLFCGASVDGELDAVREAGKQDARLIAGTYTQAFEAEVARIFMDRQRHLIGLEDDVVDAEFTIAKQPRRKARTTAKRKPKKAARVRAK